MSGYEDRLNALKESARATQDSVAAVADDVFPDGEMRVRFEEVLAFARTVLDATDAALLTSTVSGAVETVLSEIAANPAVAAENPEPFGDRLLDSLAALPVTRGRDVEQVVKDAAATFQRSAQQRLSSLNSRIDLALRRIQSVNAGAEERDAALRQIIEEQRTALTSEVAQLQADLAARAAEYTATLASEQDTLSTLNSNQRAAFEEAELQRARAARASLADVEAELMALQERVTDEVGRRVAEIRRMEQESAQLVGAIGLAGTAERYAEEVTEQRKAADRWRIATVVFAVIAVGGAVFALVQRDQSVEHLVAKLAFSLIVGAIAAYTARQSSYHRQREQRARDLQLELTAFSPFIEPLSAEQQEEERVIMTRKTFGKTTQGPAPEEEPGPTALSLMLRNKQAAQNSAQDGAASV